MAHTNTSDSQVPDPPFPIFWGKIWLVFTDTITVIFSRAKSVKAEMYCL